jgi:hypothetical protein
MRQRGGPLDTSMTASLAPPWWWFGTYFKAWLSTTSVSRGGWCCLVEGGCDGRWHGLGKHSQSPADAFGHGGVVSVSGWLWGLMELSGDGMMVWLGGGSVVLFILSDVHPVIGRVVSFLC